MYFCSFVVSLNWTRLKLNLLKQFPEQTIPHLFKAASYNNRDNLPFQWISLQQPVWHVGLFAVASIEASHVLIRHVQCLSNPFPRWLMQPLTTVRSIYYFNGHFYNEHFHMWATSTSKFEQFSHCFFLLPRGCHSSFVTFTQPYNFPAGHYVSWLCLFGGSQRL
jgi:hypothetical protein